MAVHYNTSRLAAVDKTKIAILVAGVTIPWAVIIFVARQLLATFH